MGMFDLPDIVNVSCCYFRWKLVGFALNSIPFAVGQQEKAPAAAPRGLII
jgi:hypothetical protein